MMQRPPHAHLWVFNTAEPIARHCIHHNGNDSQLLTTKLLCQHIMCIANVTGQVFWYNTVACGFNKLGKLVSLNISHKY